MGRPLPPKILLSEDNPIPVYADLGSGATDAWIIRQRGTHTFDATDGAITFTVKLQEHAPEAPGQAQCIIDTLDGDKVVRQISMNHVKTFDDEVFQWFFEGDLSEGWGRFKQGEEFSLEVKKDGVPLVEPSDITYISPVSNGIYGLTSSVTFGVSFPFGGDEGNFEDVYAHIHDGTDVINSQQVSIVNDRITVELTPGMYVGVRIILTAGPNVESTPLAYIGVANNAGYFNIYNFEASLPTPTIEIFPDDVESPDVSGISNPGFIASISGIDGPQGRLSWAFDQTDINYWPDYVNFTEDDVANIEFNSNTDLSDGPHTISFVIFDDDFNRSPVATYNFTVSAG